MPGALSAPRRRRITLCVIRPTGATSGLRSRVVRSGDELLVLFGQLRVEV
ncbi:hypothetical protein CSC46_4557 [Pseudomonas aeruginosa]|nr:hypothetical protein CSC46_4557 [Pseudomonas aeruginosa]